MHQARWIITIGASLTLGATTILAAHHTLGPTASTIAVIATTAIAVLVLTHRWLDQLGNRLADATQERRNLQELATQHQVAQIAHTALREQLIADATAAERAAASRAAAAEAAADERATAAIAQIRQEFEDKRAVELAASYMEGAMNERNGSHAAWQGNLNAGLVYLADRRRPREEGAASVSNP